MAKILIYNGTTPEWIEVNAANVDASGEAPLLKFDAVENFVEEFLADTEAGSANRQQMADTMAANETFVNDVATTEQLAINVAADTQLATNVVAVEGFIGDVASDLVANHLEQIKGEPGESFQIDDSGELTTGIAAGIMEESGASSTDFYLYLVTVDNRNLEDLEEGLEGIDAANQNTLDDLSRHVIMWDGQSWHDYGQFTALQGPTGAQGAQGAQGNDSASILEFIYLDSNQYEGNLNLQNENGKFTLDLNDGLLEYINSINMNIADSHDVSLFSSHDIINSKKYQIVMKDSNGKYNILSSSKQTILKDNYQSVGAIADLSSYTYRGFKVAINRIWGDDPSINQLIIYSENDNPVISVDGDTGDEDFAVTGLTNQSSIVAAINVYGNDSNNPIDGSRLIQFFITFVDHVIYTADVLNDINFIKLKFYNNFYKFKQLLSDVLYKKFTFNDFDSESGYGFNNINDGSDDQYDGGNYINTNLQSEIMYGNADANGQGEIQTGNDAAAAFGEGSSYVTLYKDSIFAMIATGASITSLSYSGDLGADGSGSEELLTQIEETPAFSIPYAVNFEDLEIVKVDSDFQISHEDVITFDFKVIGQAEQISTWFNPSSQNTWNIETYNSGGTFNLIAKNEGDPIPSVTWWDYQNTPTVKFYNNTNYFRGAIINYHALTDDGTIIGTIHISRDTGDNEVIHTESKSGGPNLNLHDLWYCEQEGVLKYRYDIEGVSHSPQTLRIHWTSTVFNGQDYWD